MGQDRLMQLRDAITSKVVGQWWCHHRNKTAASW
jgi:hypothetical protein